MTTRTATNVATTHARTSSSTPSPRPRTVHGRESFEQTEGAPPETTLAATARTAHKPAPAQPALQNPQVGKDMPGPRLTADASTNRPSPKHLKDEAEFFAETRSMLDNAKAGDIVGVQMYEFENEAVNGDKDAATKAPGFADQQAILPSLVAAAKRGVTVNVILDASMDAKTGQRTNQGIVDYLNKNAGSTGKMFVDYYPPDKVNIDHAKESYHLTPNRDGSYEVKEAIGGGSNYGNHTPANNDGGMAFYGIDAVGAVQIFYEDQAHCRGRVANIEAPAVPATNPVQWYATTPSNPGSEPNAILDAELGFLKQADTAYIQEFVLTQKDLLAELTRMGPNAHVLLDSGEAQFDKVHEADLVSDKADAKWSNVPDGGKLHRKEGVYLSHGKILGATIGSANATTNGDIDSSGSHKTNHEIDAAITNFTSPDGKYSTEPALQSMLANAQANLQQGLATPQKGENDVF